VTPSDTHPLTRLLCPRTELPLLDPAPPRAIGGRHVVCRPLSDEVSSLTAARELRGRPLWYQGLLSEGDCQVPFSFRDAYNALVWERWTESAADGPAPWQLAAFYRLKPLIPRPAQIALRRRLVGRKKLPEFPRWPLDVTASDLLKMLVHCALLAEGSTQLRFRWFWPAGHRAALILTHDVESAEGLRLALEIADLEEERGFRSSFNVVADWYPIDWAVVEELRSRGFEIGLHGLKHDRSLFSSREAFCQQTPHVAAALEQLGAVGFRSPSTHRVLEWIAELPIEYDCTVPLSDPYEPQPGGSCSPWPYFLGPVVELPWTLPQDHLLLTLLGHESPRFWLEQVAALEREAGLIQFLTHPDPGYIGSAPKRRIYAELLDELAARRRHLWHALPRDVAAWWRQRAAAGDDPDRAVEGVAVLSDGVVSLNPA
jgi:peptidoglycan/xylan/chitin deacetylase (PgdA/CDA1 family)